MQHQMSCLGLHQTHFLEAKYDTFKSLREAVSAKMPYGVVLEFYKDGFTYIYSPDDTDLEKWEAETVHITEPGVYIRTIYWRMAGYQMKVVKRDLNWLKEMGPHLKKFWRELHDLRADPKKVSTMIRDRESKKKYTRPGPSASVLLL